MIELCRREPTGIAVGYVPVENLISIGGYGLFRVAPMEFGQGKLGKYESATVHTWTGKERYS